MFGKKFEAGVNRASPKNSEAQSKKNPTIIYDAIIIGAGFSGAFTAEKACQVNPQAKIAIIDSYGLLNPMSSSQNECFKMHIGLHYISDRATAETCLRHSVEMADAFYDFILDKDNPRAPSRRGTHYIMSNSLSNEYVDIECNNLTALYESLLPQFPNARKAFGEPKNFITYLNELNDYSHVANKINFINAKNEAEDIHVRLGIETPECQIDIRQFRDYFEKVFLFLRRSKQLTQFYGYTVTRIQHAQDFLGYSVETRRFEDSTSTWVTETLLTKSVINCSWQNIDNIDSHLNFDHSDRRPSTIRVKGIVTAVTPPDLDGKLNTCIFSQGPHASLTRMPDNKLIITYEPETNLGHFPSGTPLHRVKSGLLKTLLTPNSSKNSNEAKQRELSIIGSKILEGASKYVPLLKDAEIESTTLGFVKVFSETKEGNEYLYDPNDPISRRRENGIQQRSLCYISFSGMKMTYSFKAAIEVVELLQEQLIIREELDSLIKTIIAQIIQNGGSKFHIMRSALIYLLAGDLLLRLQKVTLQTADLARLKLNVKQWIETIDIIEVIQQYSEKLENPIVADEIKMSPLFLRKERVEEIFYEIVNENFIEKNTNLYCDLYHSLQSLLAENLEKNSTPETCGDNAKITCINEIKAINSFFLDVISKSTIDGNKYYVQLWSFLYDSLRKFVINHEKKKDHDSISFRQAILALSIWKPPALEDKKACKSYQSLRKENYEVPGLN